MNHNEWMSEESDVLDDNEPMGTSFETSLEKIEAKEKLLMSERLEQIEDVLYASDDLLYPKTDKNISDNDSDHYYRQQDRQLQPMSHREILEWRNNFPYLRLIGESIYQSSHQYNQNYDSTSLKLFDSLNSLISPNKSNTTCNSLLNEELIVVGSSCHFHPSDILQSCDEEIIMQDGILEEIIAIDKSDESSLGYLKSLSNDSLEPEIVKKQEIIDHIFDEIWKESVKSLNSLIELVLEEFTKQHKLI